MYPGLDGKVIEEAHFRLEQYLGEIERAYAALKDQLVSRSDTAEVKPTQT
jgi:hypothetical protein